MPDRGQYRETRTQIAPASGFWRGQNPEAGAIYGVRRGERPARRPTTRPKAPAPTYFEGSGTVQWTFGLSPT